MSQDTSLESLIATLSAPQQAAVSITKLAIDCFNSGEGTGLFTGVERYSVLCGRLQVCAVQAQSLTSFWALLLRRMNWPIPPKAADPKIVQCCAAQNGLDVLRVIASEAASIVTLARMAHDQDKATRKALHAAEKQLQAEELSTMENTAP